MSEIRLHDKIFVPFVAAADIQHRVKLLADEIDKTYKGKTPLALGILNGSFVFAADLLRGMSTHPEVTFVRLSSYSDTASTGNVVTAIGLPDHIAGRDILLIEDIIDTGTTLHQFLPALLAQRPASVRIAAFLTKPSVLKYPDVHADFCAFEIEDAFVVGYGLDYNGLGRNLPGLYMLRP